MPSNNWDTTTDSDRLETVITNEDTGDHASVSPNNELQTSDILDNGGTNTTINVTAGTPVELKVGASKLANRKYVIFQALDIGVTWGFSSGTQSFDAFKDQIFFMPVGENTEIWFDTAAGTDQVAIGEVA